MLWTALETGVLECRRGFFFQAEDGIRGAQESRGLGDVYKRQGVLLFVMFSCSDVSLKMNTLLKLVNANSGLTIAPPVMLV